MTDEECLNICEVAIKCFEHKHSRIIPTEPDFMNNIIKQIAKKEEERQAILIIIEALEKQIPKKPIIRTEEDRFYKDYICPNCNVIIEQAPNVEKNKILILPQNKYCVDCGQAIDWGDE